ncbi:Protein phosphatase methylesterase 1 [Cichlidogyrus casuarinus]|uniref:Protein phosphatase methylesterase 1 n=1 Tax=Cichlidogyrus casuarinus TaxID=1844966 RepID=A0ABD2QAA5_9PLAT
MRMLKAGWESRTGRGSSEFKGGYGLLRGYISTKVPETGDIAQAGFASLISPENSRLGFVQPYSFEGYNCLVMRFRGDGRTYRINFQYKSPFLEFHHDLHQFLLYTRGGPHWQIAKIPLHKFYVSNKTRLVQRQYSFQHAQISKMIITLMDGNPGPFSLEIDYVAFYNDGQLLNDSFNYEQYKNIS